MRWLATQTWRSTDETTHHYVDMLRTYSADDWEVAYEEAHLVDWYRVLMASHLRALPAVSTPEGPEGPAAAGRVDRHRGPPVRLRPRAAEPGRDVRIGAGDRPDRPPAHHREPGLAEPGRRGGRPAAPAWPRPRGASATCRSWCRWSRSSTPCSTRPPPTPTTWCCSSATEPAEVRTGTAGGGRRVGRAGPAPSRGRPVQLRVAVGDEVRVVRSAFMAGPYETTRTHPVRISRQTSRMESPAARLLKLLSLLQTRPAWTADELAERMERHHPHRAARRRPSCASSATRSTPSPVPTAATGSVPARRCPRCC